MKTFGRWVACIIYIIAVAAVCGYVLFPEETAKRCITARLNRINPHIAVRIERVSPIFPPGLRLQKCVLDYRTQDVFEADEIRVFPALPSLLGDLKKFSFQIFTPGGTIHGWTKLSEPAPDARFEMDAQADAVQLEHFLPIKEMLQHEVTGRLSGRVQYARGAGNGSNLNARIDIQDLAVSLNLPGFNLDRTDFEHLRADIRIDNDQIRVAQLTLSGAELEGRLSGGGVMNRNLWESTIELKGTLRPKFEGVPVAEQPATGGKGTRTAIERMELPVTIYGALNNLRFSMK
jgi:type II secretion system protein N